MRPIMSWWFSDMSHCHHLLVFFDSALVITVEAVWKRKDSCMRLGSRKEFGFLLFPPLFSILGYISEIRRL